MRSEELRAIDEVTVPRPWKWTDGKLLWNEEVDHCVLEHGGTSWPISPENRAAIASAMNHMPTLIALLAACERRRHCLDARLEFGVRAYNEDPYNIATPEFRERAASLDRSTRLAENAIDVSVEAVHAVTTAAVDDDDCTASIPVMAMPAANQLTAPVVRLSEDERAALDWLRKHCRTNWAVSEAHAAAAVLDRLLTTGAP